MVKNTEEEATMPPSEQVFEMTDEKLQKPAFRRLTKKFDKPSKKLKKLKLLKTNVNLFSGPVPVSGETKKYGRGGFDDVKGMKVTGKLRKKRLVRAEKKAKSATKLAARTELLLTEEPGFVEADSDEETFLVQQTEIKHAVDITAATKSFDLDLRQFGPYRMNYSRNGRNLLLGGRKSHVAAIDWVTKNLKCEMNVMESVHDVRWLHNETLYAVAQKEWVHVYDQNGIEIHCLKQLDRVLRMEFLPYHFLLATASERGFLSWLDVSVGKVVNQYPVKGMPRLSMLTQNPWNACLCLGLPNGTVSFWSPNVKEPLAKMLASSQPLKAVAIDNRGQYLVTSSCDNLLKVWDVRNFKELRSYKLPAAPQHLTFSQTGLLACGVGNVIDIYRDICDRDVDTPYLRHKMHRPIHQLEFAPFEDVLGVGHMSGFSSILVPGSGEPNFDAYESNPFQSRKQRRESEVKALLEKIQPELITLDPTQVVKVDVEAAKKKLEEKKNLLYVKPKEIEFEPRKKAKAKGGSVKAARVKQGVRAEKVREFVKNQTMAEKKKEAKGGEKPTRVASLENFDPLARFKPKKKKAES